MQPSPVKGNPEYRLVLGDKQVPDRPSGREGFGCLDDATRIDAVVAVEVGERARLANHASTRTTQLYDRREEHVTLDEVERITI